VGIRREILQDETPQYFSCQRDKACHFSIVLIQLEI